MNHRWIGIAGGGAIFLFCILMIVRLGIPAKLISGGRETVTPIQAGVPVGESWMNITQGGRKIGYAQRTYARSDNGFRFSENVFMRINTMGIVQPLTVRTAAELKPDRTLSNFQFDLGSNLFKFAALIAIYLYNFSVLPMGQSKIRTVYLQNIFSFLNMGLAAFVLTAIAARFVYPAVSFEGDAFWIVRAAPISIKTFLWVKFAVYGLPLLILAEILIVSSNLLLHVTPLMMGLSVVTILLMTPGVVALGVGLGAAYPDFQSENPAQAVTSFGGLLFMLLAAGFIAAVVILEAGPVYQLFMADFHGRSLFGLQWIWLIISFAIVLLLCALAVILPMRLGERRLRE